MTKETMIWQTLSMIIAGMVMRKELPLTKELFEEKVIRAALSILEFSKEDIQEVLHTTNVTEFSKILSKLYTN